MRSLVIAALLLFATGPAFAQTAPQNASPSDTDRAEQDLRSSLAPSGVTVERVAPDEIRLTMPSDITFDFDRAEVSAKFLPRLRDLARTLEAHPALSVGIVGHTDTIGSDAYNQTLSERRARSVSIALEEYAVPDDRIIASGMGELRPIASNASEDGRALNRRVEITLKAEPKK
jgi:outer membrane protein OmpA-like peptidoglycan-associated protein